MDNIDSYMSRKHGREEPDYLASRLEPILKETYGVIIYQEQVMQIAQTLAGYSLGEADLLRRAMGKKIKKEMDKQRATLRRRRRRQWRRPRTRAENIFELVAKFAGYGFNKSHAAAYALIAYQTAYLKANYPVEFMAASMTLDIGNTDKLNGFAQEARRLGIRIEPPSINHSETGFLPSDGAIRYSLAALKNVGRHAVDHIVAEREERGPFRDLADFAQRINPRSVNKRALETLAAAGALDELGPDRATAYANVDRIIAAGSRSLEASAEGQNDLFAGASREPPPIDFRPAKPWVPTDRLGREFEAVGFFLTGHPLDDYRDVLETLGAETWAEFAAKARMRRVVGTVAGTVLAKRERKGKSGNAYAFVSFSDPTGQFEAVVFSEALGGLPRAARARHRGPARARGRGRRRHHQDPGAEPEVTRPRGRRLPFRHEDLSRRHHCLGPARRADRHLWRAGTAPARAPPRRPLPRGRVPAAAGDRRHAEAAQRAQAGRGRGGRERL